MTAPAPRCISPSGATKTRFRETPAYQEGLWSLGSGLYAWMVPNGSWGESNAGLVIGEGESLLIDTLWDIRYTRTMLDAMSPLMRGAPLSMLVNTHADGDHFWGNQLIPDGVETITSAAARAEMDMHKPGAMLAFSRLGELFKQLPLRSMRRTGHWFTSMCLPYAFDEVKHTPAASTFTGTVWKQVGGRKVQLIEVGPAHTSGDLIVYVPDAGTLFSGDILFIGSTPVMWAGPVENWLRALDIILDLDAETIVPGHGPVTNKDGVRMVKTYWEFVRGAARRCFDKKLNPADAARQIVASREFTSQPFAAWDSPERMMTNVHLLYRQFAGRKGHLSAFAKVNILRKQALLAHDLPHASPALMRRGDASL